MSTWKILVNDGLEESGLNALREAGFVVDTQKVPQEELKLKLQEYHGIIVRSATKVRKEQIDSCKGLKFIARGGVGMDNIDVEYAVSKGIKVINTPAASSRSVAELAMGHILTLTRSLQETNRSLKDESSFSSLKKKLASSTEVNGKTLVLLGFGRIGSELAKMAVAIGMKVKVVDPFISAAELQMNIYNNKFSVKLELISKQQALEEADYISLHAPFSGEAILGYEEFKIIKHSSILINTSRGENIDESALLDALNSNKLAAAGLDVFHNEPNINPDLLVHPRISLSPHIGASTKEAQERVAEELVEKIMELRTQLNAI
ncbi:MAG: D-2-hydroxyacid dehydrogenase [Saprospiraceae bacterium]